MKLILAITVVIVILFVFDMSFQIRGYKGGGVTMVQGPTVYEIEYEDEKMWQMWEDFYVCRDDTQEVFLIPATYVTDFYSIPKWASVSRFFLDQEAYAVGAIVHDWLYAVGKPGDEEGRLIADDILLGTMRQMDLNWVLRGHIYTAVRLGGAKAYGREDEWQRFSSLNELGEQILGEAPFEKPTNALIAEGIDCGELDEFITQRGAT